MKTDAPRTCGTCTVCCKVMSVPTLDKPTGAWCQHCDVGKGCRIYATKPDECTGFVCAWRAGNFDDDERPDQSGVVASMEKTPIGVVARFSEYRDGAAERPRMWRHILALLAAAKADGVAIIGTDGLPRRKWRLRATGRYVELPPGTTIRDEK